MPRRFIPTLTNALLISLLLGGVTACGTVGASDSVAGAGYWHTKGTSIIDAHGYQVRIAAVNWYGMESTYWVPAGLDYQRYTKIMDQVKSLGYNAIRLSFSNQLIEQNPIVTKGVKANPEFKHVHAMTVMDAIVDYARTIGLKIILDDHRSAAAGPLMVNHLDEPLWYTAQYPQSAWIKDWVSLARRYRGNQAVVGFDLRNEPHTAGAGPWGVKAYLNQGATWGPYHGVDNPKSDWRLASEKAGDAVLAVNPHLLMFVEGLEVYPDPSQPRGLESYFWSGILKPARQYPVVFTVPHHLVYEAHDWGPWKWNFPWFHPMSYSHMVRVWNANWAFIINNPKASYAAPVWLGEFGTCTNNPQCVDTQRTNNQAMWFHDLLRYMHANPQIGWAFFALDGTNSNDHAANNGLLNSHWNGVANQKLQNDLRAIQ